MIKKGLVFLFLTFSLLVPLVIPLSKATTRTWRVPMDFPSIQGAIDNANPGDTVFVYNGTYNERILVWKSLVVLGQDSQITIIDGGGLGTVVNINASLVTVNGFTVRNSGVGQGDCGITLRLVSSCLVFGNNIVDNAVGVLLNNASLNTFYHNNFVNNTVQVSLEVGGYFNNWDDGYPSGGNYWSDQVGTDNLRGPTQSQPGSDGILDTPYVVDADNVDHYPFASYWRAKVVRNLSTRFTYGSIQEAIDAPETSDGNTILVYKGVFYENVIVNKSLHLSGEGISDTVIDGGGVGTVVYVDADNVSIANFTLRDSGSAWLDSAVVVHNSTSASVSGDAITSSYVGIYLDNSTDCVLEGNDVSAVYAGVSLEYSDGNAIRMNNITTQAGIGLSLYYSGSNVAEQNQIRFGREGVRLASSSDNKIHQNILVDNNYDVHIMYSYDNELSGNDFRGVGYAGLVIDYGGNNVVGGNNVRNHTVGVSLRESSGNTIYYNNFINNAYHVLIYPQGFSNNWNMDYPVCGNYWSDYTGVDVKSGANQNQSGSDGIGDTPYSIDSLNKDNYPQIRMVNLTTAVYIHDVFVRNVTVPENRIYQGKYLTITVQVANLGNFTETFAVTVYYDTNIIGTTGLVGFRSRAESTLEFTWNTMEVTPNRTYAIKAVAGPVPGEINLNNSQFVISVTVTFYRDLAVSSITVSPTVVYQRGLVNITAVVSNLGNIPETPMLNVFYGQNLIDSRMVAGLPAHSNVSLNFAWNTSGVAAGLYLAIVVKVDPVPDEVILENNAFSGAPVNVRIVGDVNGDNVVNIIDIAAIGTAFRSKIGDQKYRTLLDLNLDGVINILDLTLAAVNFGVRAGT
jgi:parallel beta-helix repeat protein